MMDMSERTRKLRFSSPTLEHDDRVKRRRYDAALAADESESSIQRLYLSCLDVLESWIERSGNGKAENNSLRRCHGTLQLWAHQYGVRDGALDNKLRYSAEIRNTVLGLLTPLCKTALRGISTCLLPPSELNEIRDKYRIILHVEQQNRLRNDPDPSLRHDGSGDEALDTGIEPLGISLAIRKIKTYTECLLDLSPALDNPALEDSPRKMSALELEQRSIQESHTERLRAIFPLAEMALLNIVGRLNRERSQHLKYEGKLRISDRVSVTPDGKLYRIYSANDRGLNSSIPAASSSHAVSKMSISSSAAGGERLQIPLLPAAIKVGASFKCIACDKFVRCTSDDEWVEHLIADMRPYFCFFTNCSFGANTFEQKSVWIAHLELHHGFRPHWKSLECPFCLEVTLTEKNTTIDHLSRHMKDIAIAAMPQDVESDSESDDESNLRNESSIGINREAPSVPIANSTSSALAISDPVHYAFEVSNPTGSAIETLEQARVEFWTSRSHLTEAQRQEDWLKLALDPDFMASGRSFSEVGWSSPAEPWSLTAHSDHAFFSPTDGTNLSSSSLSKSEPSSQSKAVAMQLPDGRYHCSELGCYEIYLRAGDCRRHLRKHNGPFHSCTQPGCDKKFHRVDKLQNHLRQAHNITVAAPHRKQGLLPRQQPRSVDKSHSPEGTLESKLSEE